MTDLWPLAFMIGLYVTLYLISRVVNALGFKPTVSRRPGTPFPPTQKPSGAARARSARHDQPAMEHPVTLLPR